MSFFLEVLTSIPAVVAFFANIAEIGAGAIAIYLFFWKGKYISAAINALLSYSMQLTLTELTRKLDDLNDLNKDDPADRAEVLNVLNDIAGQLHGNPRLTIQFADIIEKINQATVAKKALTQPAKRRMVSEIRERLRQVSISTMASISEEGK